MLPTIPASRPSWRGDWPIRHSPPTWDIPAPPTSERSSICPGSSWPTLSQASTTTARPRSASSSSAETGSPAPIALSDTHAEFLRRAGGSLAGVTRSLDQLEGSLVANISRDGHQGWVFAHPTMMDAYADRLRSPEFVHFLVEGFGTRALLAQTTCGDTGLRNAIVLPESIVAVSDGPTR